MTGDFRAATAVSASGPTSYDATIDGQWTIGGIPNGGYLLALLSRAAMDTTGQLDPLAVSGHFLRPPVVGPAEVVVEQLKSGRRTSTARASLWQDGTLRLDALVTTGRLPAAGEPIEDSAVADWSDLPQPAMPSPEECPVSEHAMFRIELLDVVEQRVDPSTSPFGLDEQGNVVPSPTGTPMLRAWQRLADGSDPDPLFAVVASDSLPPTVFNLGGYGWAPTVELSVLLRGRPCPGWLVSEARTRTVSSGWFDEDCTVWDSSGRIVAQARQLAIVGRS